MSIAECYVIDAQCDDTLHGEPAVREQFTGDSKPSADAALRHEGWQRIGENAVRCPVCRQERARRVGGNDVR